MLTKQESRQIIEFVKREIRKNQFGYLTDGKIDFYRSSVGQISGGNWSGILADGSIYNRHISTNADIAGTKIRIATVSDRGTVQLANNLEESAGKAVQSDDDRLTNTFLSLFDSPETYSGYANNIIVINSSESGIEFSDKIMICEDIDDNNYSGLFITGKAGESLSFGDSIIFENDVWIKTLSTEENKTDGFVGLVVSSGEFNINDDIQILARGYIRNDLWSFSGGEHIYISSISGELTNDMPSGDEFLRIVGYAKDSNQIWYSPDNTVIKLKFYMGDWGLTTP